MTTQQINQLQAKLTLAHSDFGKMLYSRAFFKLHDNMLSEDLVQETFIKTWGYLVKNGKIDTMKAFLYRVLNNLIVDEYRKHKALSLDVIMEQGFEPIAGDPKRIYNLLDGKTAFHLIKHLPKTCQRVMQMRYVQELSLQEISLMTGQSKNAISVQTHRGLEKLKHLYNNGLKKIPAFA